MGNFGQLRSILEIFSTIFSLFMELGEKRLNFIFGENKLTNYKKKGIFRFEYLSEFDNQ